MNPVLNNKTSNCNLRSLHNVSTPLRISHIRSISSRPTTPSSPSNLLHSSYPSRAYRNPLNQLVRFLDAKHGDNWAIWEFRAEGTGYSDSDVYNRIRHYPWPDHHPPPFALVPLIVASMRDWLHSPAEEAAVGVNQAEGARSESGNGRVVVVHCKAGKGRSGTSLVSYLMSEEGWSKSDALQRFTERRMRPGFGAGVSIPSQLRYVDYVERWVKSGKMYVEQEVEVLEVQVWGLRDGVRVAIEGFVDEGKRIETVHVFGEEEGNDIDRDPRRKMLKKANTEHPNIHEKMYGAASPLSSDGTTGVSSSTSSSAERKPRAVGPRDTRDGSATLPHNTRPLFLPTSAFGNVSFRPSTPILLSNNDINLSVQRRSHARYGLTMVTSVAHVWFNAFFEGQGPEEYAIARIKAMSHGSSSQSRRELSATASGEEVPGAPWAASSGVFEIAWDAMDGIKGSSKRGVRAFDKVAVAWRVPSAEPVLATAVDINPNV